MTKFKKIAAAFCAAAMAVCSMAAMTVSAAEPQLPPSSFLEQTWNQNYGNYTRAQLRNEWEKFYYHPTDGQRFRTNVYNGYMKMEVQYRKATNDYKVLSYHKNGVGDVNADGKINTKDVVLIQRIAALRLANLNPLTHGYTEDQCWRAAVTQPFGCQVENADAAVVLAYINSKSYVNTSNWYDSYLEDFICAERSSLIRYEDIEYQPDWEMTQPSLGIGGYFNMEFVLHSSKGFYVNVNCKNRFLK